MATFYVDTVNGANSNDGTSPAQAVKTINHGCGLLSPGDTLVILSGTYTESLNLATNGLPNGTSWENSTKVKVAPGATVTIQHSAATPIRVNNNNQYIEFDASEGTGIIDGLSASGTFSGVGASGDTHHIRFKGWEVKNCAHNGFGVTNPSLHHWEIIDCHVHHCGLTSTESQPHGIYAGGHSFLIEGCHVHHCAGFGIHQFQSNDGSDNNVVRRNICHDNGQVNTSSAGIIIGSGTQNKCYNNICYSETVGIQIAYAWEAGNQNNSALNNTVVDCVVGIQINNSAGDNPRVVNNLIWNCQTPINDLDSDTVKQTNHLPADGDPLFVDEQARDYRLADNSPALAAGTDLSGEFTDDHDGNTRPASWSIGAFDSGTDPGEGGEGGGGNGGGGGGSTVDLQVQVPMVAFRIQSLSGQNAEWRQTETILDPDHYDGATYYFEIVGLNQNASDKYVKLVDTAGNEYAEITLPGGMAFNEYTRFRSTSFSPAAAATTYRIRIEDAGNAEIVVFAGRIIVNQVEATKTRLAFQLIGEVASGTNTNSSAVTQIEGGTFGDGQEGNAPLQRFLKEESKLGDTIGDWSLECVLRHTGNGGSDAVIYNVTDDTEVSDSITNVTSSTSAVAQTTFANNASNFDDGDEFQIRIRENPTALGVAQISKATLYVEITSLGKAVSWLVLSLNQNNISTDRPEDRYRVLLEDVFSSPTYDFEVEGSLDSGTHYDAYLRDCGANDEGTTGTDVPTSEVTIDGARSRQRVTGITLTAGNRFMAAFIEDGASQIDIFGARLIVAAESGAVPADATLDADDELALEDDQEFQRYSHQAPEAEDSLSLAEALEFESSGFNLLEAADELNLSEALEFESIPFKLAEAEDAFALSDEIEHDSQLFYGQDVLVLARIYLDAGEEDASDTWVRHPERVYQGRVKSWGTVDRSVPIPGDAPTVGDGRVQIIDTDRQFRRVLAAKTPRRRIIELLMGPTGGKESLFQRVYKGEILTATFPPGLVELDVRDITFAWFDELIPKLITTDNFGLTEDLSEAFSPIIFGRVESSSLDQQGAVGCPRISATDYNVSRHACEEVTAVYRRVPPAEDFTLITTGFSIVEEQKTIEGVDYTFTHIRFNNPQDDQTEVRADVRGMMNVDNLGQSTGEAERDGAQIFKLYIQRIARRPESSLALNSFARVSDTLESLGWVFDGAVTDQMTHGEVMRQLITSTGIDLYQNKHGQIEIGLTAESDPDRHVFDDLMDLEMDSVRQMLPEPTFNRINYRYNRLYAKGEWYSELVYNNDIDQDALGEIEETTLELNFVRDAATAAAVTAYWGSWVDLGSLRIEFNLEAPRSVPFLELARLVGVTHWAGVIDNVEGFTNQEFKIWNVVLDLDQLKYTVRAVKRVAPVETVGVLLGTPAHNARFGPWLFGGGIFFAMLRPPDDNTRLRAYRSLDWGATWEGVDTANEPDFAGEIYSYDCHRNGNTLHIATQTVDARVAYHTFSLPAASWQTVDEQVATVSDPGNLERLHVSICTRRTSGEPVISFDGESVEDPGGFGSPNGNDKWRQVYFSRRTAGAWTTPVRVGQHPNGPSSAWGSPYEHRGARCVPGKGELVHFFYGRYPGDFTASTQDEFFRTLTAANTLTVEQKYLETALTYNSAPMNVGQYDTYEEDGEIYLLLPAKGAAGRAEIHSFQSIAQSSQMLNTFGRQGIGDNVAVFQGNVNPRFTHNPAAALIRTSGETHFIFQAFVGGQGPFWTVYKVNSGLGFQPPLTGQGLDACNPDGENQLDRCGAWLRAGPNYGTGQTPQTLGAVIVKIGTETWLATLTWSLTTDTATIEKIGSGTFHVFEFRKVSSLPTPSTYTLEDWANALQETP